MIASNYDLHLQCDDKRHEYWQSSYYAEYFNDGKSPRAEVYRQARKDGWRIKRDRTCFCPLHARSPKLRDQP